MSFRRSSMNPLGFFGFGKIVKFFTIVKGHGGIRSAVLKLLRVDDLKLGKLVGEDKFGNKYYENNYYFYGRNRWIIYSEKYGFDYDASQVPAEWYGWLHYKTDLIPGEDKSRPKHKWMLDHTENLTGTPEQYVPYSSTRKIIESWVPPKGKNIYQSYGKDLYMNAEVAFYSQMYQLLRLDANF